MKLRNLLTIALAAAFVFVAPITAKAEVTEGWQQDAKGWWYQVADENGAASYYKDGVHKIDGKYYYFDAKGYMKTGWIADENSYDTYYSKWDDEAGKYVEVPCKETRTDWRYANKNGELQYGWQQIDGEWYFFDIYEGVMYEDGTYTIRPVVTDEYGTHYDWDAEGKMYHFAPSGEMTTGWYYHDYPSGWGEWFYSNKNGEVYTEWQNIGGVWYYFSEYDGAMYAGTSMTEYDYEYTYDEYGNIVDYKYVKGDTYYFKANGAMVKGWYNRAPQTTYGDWVYCNSNGTAYDGWLKSGGKWYYIDNGDMRTSQYVYKYKKDANGNNIGNPIERYYVGRDGAMITGWYKYENKTANSYSNYWMYANADGTIKAQWVKSGKDWYFVDSSGDMVRDGAYTCVKDSEKNKAPERKNYASEEAYDAACRKWNQSHTYVFDKDGKMLTNAWYASKSTSGTTWYYADANGRGYNGWIKSGGNWYFCEYGVMQRNTYVEGGYWVNANGVWK